MSDLLQRLGMGWTTPWARTFVQAALPILVAAGTDWVSVELWKVALLSGGSAVLARAQLSLRAVE